MRQLADMLAASSIVIAVEVRRRELPATLAMVVLTGGVAAAIMGGSGTVAWAAIMSLLLIADLKFYQNLESAGAALGGKLTILSAWALLGSSFMAALPVALWGHGGAAGAAAAMALWVCGAARCLGPGAGGHTLIALAGAAPPALALLITPLASAAASPRADWEVAIIAVIGGGALLTYITHARLQLAAAEQALRHAARAALAQTQTQTFPAANVATPNFCAPPPQRKTG